jgi:hypothetical protein
LVALAGGVMVLLLLTDASSDALRVTAVFLGLAAIVVGLPRRAWPVGCALMVAGWWLAVVAARYVPDIVNPWPPVANVVGGAAFFGTPYQGAQLGAVLSVAIPALMFAGVAVGTSVLPRLRSRPASGSKSPVTIAEGGTESRPRRAVIVWMGAAIVAFTLVPDLRAYLHEESAPLAYGWDTSNLTAWQGFVEMGLVPMKDFFYPYGFQWLYDLRSVGPLFQWFAQVSMLAIVTWALLRLTGGRTVRVLACVLAVAVAAGWSFAVWRYLPALLVPLSYGALGPATHGRLVREHWIFGAVCLLAALVEPDLLALGLVGVALLLVGELVAGRLTWDRGGVLLRGGVDLIPVVAAALVLLLIWLLTGTAAGNLRFYTEFSSVSASSAPNEQLYGPAAFLVLHPDAYTVYAAVPALLCIGGLLWARFGAASDRAIPTILLGAAGVSLTLLLKNYVRELGDYMLLPVLPALCWSLILLWGRGSLVRAGVWGAAAGAMLCLLNEAAGTTHYLDAAASSPINAGRSISVIFDRGARTRAAVAEFAPPRFASWPDAANAGFYAATVSSRPLPRFAVVGDSQMTYVLLRQAPPYQIDMYDAGRIAEQRAMLSDLRSRPPRYIIWSKPFFQDGLPYDVRDPLVFSWMIQHYVPLKVSTATDILRRRRPGEAIPAAFWSSELGGGVDLEYIPSGSAAAQSPSCKGGADCVRYALARGHGPAGSMVYLHVSGDGRSYPVSFRVRSGVGVYPVRLDRLWFSALVGPTPSVTASTPGFTATDAGFRSGGNLY